MCHLYVCMVGFNRYNGRFYLFIYFFGIESTKCLYCLYEYVAYAIFFSLIFLVCHPDDDDDQIDQRKRELESE